MSSVGSCPSSPWLLGDPSYQLLWLLLFMFLFIVLTGVSSGQVPQEKMGFCSVLAPQYNTLGYCWKMPYFTGNINTHLHTFCSRISLAQITGTNITVNSCIQDVSEQMTTLMSNHCPNAVQFIPLKSPTPPKSLQEERPGRTSTRHHQSSSGELFWAQYLSFIFYFPPKLRI